MFHRTISEILPAIDRLMPERLLLDMGIKDTGRGRAETQKSGGYLGS